ncbi:MAG: hypothetical protein ABIZ09_06180 [Rhodoferax sp.]|jgi:hypothetical protein
MTLISQSILAQAAVTIERMGTDERLALADEISLQQPSLLASVLVLQRMGASYPEVEVVLNLLFVIYQAMKLSGYVWPVVSEQTQETCLQRLTARARFQDGLSPELAQEAVAQQIKNHTEVFLLAYVHGTLGEHDLLAARTDPEKYLLLAALNLVECVAATKALKGQSTVAKRL